jgi:hypothetical protein
MSSPQDTAGEARRLQQVSKIQEDEVRLVYAGQEKPSVEPCSPERLDTSGRFQEADKANPHTLRTARRWLKEIAKALSR